MIDYITFPILTNNNKLQNDLSHAVSALFVVGVDIVSVMLHNIGADTVSAR